MEEKVLQSDVHRFRTLGIKLNVIRRLFARERASRFANVKHVRYVSQFPCGNVSHDQSCGKSDGRYGPSTGLFDDRPKRPGAHSRSRTCDKESRDSPLRREKGKPETLFSYSYAGHSAERCTPSPISDRSRPEAINARDPSTQKRKDVLTIKSN